MKVQTFKNMKGLIHGADSKRIGCDKEGILRIGAAEIHITPEEDAIMPVLFNGCTGYYKAAFTDSEGQVYELDKVQVRGGRIVPPSDTAVELMELRCRLDEMEDECVRLQKQIDFLSGIFDTNSLNFLIK
jgi:hypothetical protein